MGPICPDRFGHVRFTRFKFVNKRCTDVCWLQTLNSDLLPERAWWAHLSRLGLPASISRKKKHCTGERTQKIRNFWTVWAIESQKAAEDSQNEININYSRGFIMLQTQLAFRFPALEINKSFFIDRIREMVSLELGKEIKKDIFHLVTSVKKFWVPMRNRTSDLRLFPRFDALPLRHRDSMLSEVYQKVQMISSCEKDFFRLVTSVGKRKKFWVPMAYRTSWGIELKVWVSIP